MKITALVVSDDVRDICDDNELPHPVDVDAWLAAHEARIEEAMEYAGKDEVRRLLKATEPEPLRYERRWGNRV